MARVKRAVNAQKKRREILDQASGYRGQRSRLYRKAKEQMLHSLTYSYRDRRARKGDFRQLWITRINAAARAEGIGAFARTFHIGDLRNELGVTSKRVLGLRAQRQSYSQRQKNQRDFG